MHTHGIKYHQSATVEENEYEAAQLLISTVFSLLLTCTASGFHLHV